MSTVVSDARFSVSHTPPPRPDVVYAERKFYNRKTHVHSYAYKRYPKFVYSSEGKVLAIERIRKIAWIKRMGARAGIGKKYRIILTETATEGSACKEWKLAKGSDWEEILRAYYYLIHEVSKDNLQRRSAGKTI